MPNIHDSAERTSVLSKISAFIREYEIEFHEIESFMQIEAKVQKEVEQNEDPEKEVEQNEDPEKEVEQNEDPEKEVEQNEDPEKEIEIETKPAAKKSK